MRGVLEADGGGVAVEVAVGVVVGLGGVGGGGGAGGERRSAARPSGRVFDERTRIAQVRFRNASQSVL